MPYIREICDRIRKSKKIKECMWYFEEYDSTERRNEFKRKITEAGYNGSYAEFRMNLKEKLQRQGIMVVMQNLECRCVSSIC
ncbi:hypothetical protein DWV78_13205 [Agathobacter rectalis]|uniref:Uncharacterized protein n=1 Tax=Agathobacter rectalis TaxID=39491 RepID=A0A413BDC3_9FIRM|nr:hypothetical protein DWV78_13205 [Agathobacter rectalis]